MKSTWYVVYEAFYNTVANEEVMTEFIGGFAEEKDAKAFLKRKKRENAESIKQGCIDFFIEERSSLSSSFK